MVNTPLAVPITTGAFAFTGVLIAQLVAICIQWRKTLNDDIRRWHFERRTLYAEYLAHCQELCDRMSDAIEIDDFTYLPNIHDEDECRLDALMNEIQLIAPKVVVDRARRLTIVVFIRAIHAWRCAIEERSLNELEDNETYDDKVRLARVEFIDAARRDLLTPSRLRTEGWIFPPKAYKNKQLPEE